MTDKRRREAERLAKQGAPDAEARAILERVRSGDLKIESVQLAARLGHSAAKLAMPETKTAKDTMKALAQYAPSELLLEICTTLVDEVRREWMARGTPRQYDTDDATQLEIEGGIVDMETLEGLQGFVLAPDVDTGVAGSLQVMREDDGPSIIKLGARLAEQSLRFCQRRANSDDRTTLPAICRTYGAFIACVEGAPKNESANTAKQRIIKIAADRLLAVES